ncbi:hypothetical protein JKP88DRAFT_261637 [Tribonema minus]|uniref:Uncharacterized protein n=1 Tax=Tribonema minus TaxID=303371 RepID=A0A836C771_9STRA|nr:hypothetical protein JKP88DRAFT_261637 [Tribonema minus]
MPKEAWLRPECTDRMVPLKSCASSEGSVSVSMCSDSLPIVLFHITDRTSREGSCRLCWPGELVLLPSQTRFGRPQSDLALLIMVTGTRARTIAGGAALCAAMANAATMVVDFEGGQARSLLVDPAYVTLGGTPYVPTTLPGVLEAEYFDMGGEGIAYHNIELEADATMPENKLRVEEDGEPVALQINDVSGATNPDASEAAGELAVGMGVTGEWMRYTVDVPAAGVFTATWRIAVHDPNGALLPVVTKIVRGTGAEADPCKEDAQHVAAGGLDLPGVNTLGYKQFGDFVSADLIALPAGEHVLAVCLTDVAAFELNYISFRPVAAFDVKSDAPAAAPAPSVEPTAQQGAADGGAATVNESSAAAGTALGGASVAVLAVIGAMLQMLPAATSPLLRLSRCAASVALSSAARTTLAPAGRDAAAAPLQSCTPERRACVATSPSCGAATALLSCATHAQPSPTCIAAAANTGRLCRTTPLRFCSHTQRVPLPSQSCGVAAALLSCAPRAQPSPI